MEFILNNKKYSILNHELFINYLIVDNYFRNRYSKYDYNIRFDFVTPLLTKEKIEFKDILEGTKDLEVLIEKSEIDFIPAGLTIDQQENGNFKITYQELDFDNIHAGEAIPFLITLHSLLTYKPIISLTQILEELENFIENFRAYNK